MRIFFLRERLRAEGPSVPWTRGRSLIAILPDGSLGCLSMVFPSSLGSSNAAKSATGMLRANQTSDPATDRGELGDRELPMLEKLVESLDLGSTLLVSHCLAGLPGWCLFCLHEMEGTDAQLRGSLTRPWFRRRTSSRGDCPRTSGRRWTRRTRTRESP